MACCLAGGFSIGCNDHQSKSPTQDPLRVWKEGFPPNTFGLVSYNNPCFQACVVDLIDIHEIVFVLYR